MKNMGHKTSNTTDGFDMMTGTRTLRTDGPKGSGYGAGNNQAEADKSSYEHYQRADPNDSNFVSSSSGGGSSGGDSGGGGGSCCYVTTACLDALGLSRDSLELRAMKTLTNNHILQSFSGKRDYVLYQRKGPAIVQAIESREDSQGIWKRVYESLRDVTTSVLSGNYERGHQSYKELILGLEKQFVPAR